MKAGIVSLSLLCLASLPGIVLAQEADSYQAPEPKQVKILDTATGGNAMRHNIQRLYSPRRGVIRVTPPVDERRGMLAWPGHQEDAADSRTESGHLSGETQQ